MWFTLLLLMYCTIYSWVSRQIGPRHSSVAMERGAIALPVGLESMQNATSLVLLRPIFAQKAKIAPPPIGIGDENWSILTLDLKWFCLQKTLLSLGKIYFFFCTPSNFGLKNRPNLNESLFFGLHLISSTKTVLILARRLPRQMVLGQTGTGQMGLRTNGSQEKWVLGQMGPGQTSPRTTGFRKNGFQGNWVRNKWAPGQMGSGFWTNGFQHKWVLEKWVQNCVHE